MQNIKQIVVAALLTTLGATTLLPMAASASEAGRKNTTLGLGALTGVLLYKKQWIPAAATAAGTYFAYHNWQAAINARHRKQAQLAYRRSYNRGYLRSYSSPSYRRTTTYSRSYYAPTHYMTYHRSTSSHRRSVHRVSYKRHVTHKRHTTRKHHRIRHA